MPSDAFFALIEKSKAVDESETVSLCEHLIKECVNDASSGNVDTKKENQLAAALSSYIGVTKAYQLSEEATKTNHFAVIRYGATGTIRPFSMGGSP